MPQQECPLDGDLAKPGEASLQYVYRYACTMKPNMKLEQNNESIMNIALKNQFDDLDSRIENKKFELDSNGVLHVHFTYITSTKIKSYYRYFKKGWMIHLSFLKDEPSYQRWCHYLTKGDPNDQVLFEARCQREYMFV